MKAFFVELPAFSRYRHDYVDDDAFRKLQLAMMKHPEARDVIEGTGGLRKLFTLYDKDEMADLSPDEKRQLKAMLKAELGSRT